MCCHISRAESIYQENGDPNLCWRSALVINKTFVCLVFSTTCAKPEYFIGLSIHASCHLSASASKDVALQHLHYRPISAAFPGTSFPLVCLGWCAGSPGFSWVFLGWWCALGRLGGPAQPGALWAPSVARNGGQERGPRRWQPITD